MVAEATGRISRRKDGKYFLYLPKHLVEDSAFPFKVESTIPVRVVINRDARGLLVIRLRIRNQDRRRDPQQR